MKDGIPKMTISMVAFAAIACIALAFVYAGTKDAIDGWAAKDLANAQKELFPKADKFTDVFSKLAKPESPKVTFDAAWEATTNGQVTGMEVRAYSAGFQDNITVLTGLDTTGTITGIKILSINDTPGLGMNSVNPNYFVGDPTKKITFWKQFTGMKATDNIMVNKDTNDKNEKGIVIPITAATISSRAISLIVENSVQAAAAYMAQQNGGK
jgi:electron transport complex protein RnfG